MLPLPLFSRSRPRFPLNLLFFSLQIALPAASFFLATHLRVGSSRTRKVKLLQPRFLREATARRIPTIVPDTAASTAPTTADAEQVSPTWRKFGRAHKAQVSYTLFSEKLSITPHSSLGIAFNTRDILLIHLRPSLLTSSSYTSDPAPADILVNDDLDSFRWGLLLGQAFAAGPHLVIHVLRPGFASELPILGRPGHSPHDRQSSSSPTLVPEWGSQRIKQAVCAVC